MSKAADPVGSELDDHGMKWVKTPFHVRGNAKVVTCCGCGFPVNQNNPRCWVRNPDAYMGTYGPCCAPTGRRLAKLQRRADKRLRKQGKAEQHADAVVGPHAIARLLAKAYSRPQHMATEYKTRSDDA